MINDIEWKFDNRTCLPQQTKAALSILDLGKSGKYVSFCRHPFSDLWLRSTEEVKSMRS